MATVEGAVQSQARNIEQATGRSMEEWVALVKASGKERHTDILEWLKAEHGFSHGNANAVWIGATSHARRLGATKGPGRCLTGG